MRILMLDLDTVRADHLGCYGYQRNTSPNIDSIAKDGILFENYYCSDAPCLPSRTALMSGKFGIHTGVVNHGGTCANFRIDGEKREVTDSIGRNSLPMFLRTLGFYTASISTFAERHSAWWFNAGFNELHNVGKCGVESAEEVTPTVLKWIEENGTKDNWFLHVNYWDAHTPFRTPQYYKNQFEEDNFKCWISEERFKDHRKNKIGPHGAREIGMYTSDSLPQFPKYMGEIKNYTELIHFFNEYDSGINYMDLHIGKIIELLKDKGIYDDLAIIITADHGETIGEFGIYAEHATSDYITTRIPMIIKWPKAMKNYKDYGFHYNLDLAPTLAELFNKEKNSYWDGQSYANSILKGIDTGRNYLVLSQCSHVCQRSVRFKDYLYIKTYHDGYHLFPNEMLFNVKEDPHETINLAEEKKDICIKCSYLLQRWHDKMMMTNESDIDPLWTVMKEGGPYYAKGQLRKYCKRLENTGRGWAIPELKRKHPKEFK